MPTRRPAAWNIIMNSKIPAVEYPDLHATADEVQRSVARLEVSDRFIQRSPPNIYGIVRPHSRLNASHVLLQTLCNQNIIVKSAKNKEFLCRCECVQRFQDFMWHSMCVEGADTSRHLPYPPRFLSLTHKQHHSTTKPANSWVFFDIIGGERKVIGTNQHLSQSDNMMTQHSQISVNQTHADTSVVYLRFNK